MPTGLPLVKMDGKLKVFPPEKLTKEIFQEEPTTVTTDLGTTGAGVANGAETGTEMA